MTALIIVLILLSPTLFLLNWKAPKKAFKFKQEVKLLDKESKVIKVMYYDIKN
jgi:hypothetical protein